MVFVIDLIFCRSLISSGLTRLMAVPSASILAVLPICGSRRWVLGDVVVDYMGDLMYVEAACSYVCGD